MQVIHFARSATNSEEMWSITLHNRYDTPQQKHTLAQLIALGIRSVTPHLATGLGALTTAALIVAIRQGLHGAFKIHVCRLKHIFYVKFFRSCGATCHNPKSRAPCRQQDDGTHFRWNEEFITWLKFDLIEWLACQFILAFLSLARMKLAPS